MSNKIVIYSFLGFLFSCLTVKSDKIDKYKESVYVELARRVFLLLCEVCGREIFGAPFRAIIEGANLAVCSQCSKLGSGFWEEPKTTPKHRARTSRPNQPITFAKRKKLATMPETLELAENVGQLVRQAREGLGMSHEDLGRKTRERVSILRKIENNKMVPDLVLAEKLEHTLKIKLLVPPIDANAQISSTNKRPQGATLGDLINFKLKETEAKK